MHSFLAPPLEFFFLLIWTRMRFALPVCWVSFVACVYWCVRKLNAFFYFIFSCTENDNCSESLGGGSCSSGGSGNSRTQQRRSSIVVIPPMQICPGDLLVYSKVLTQRSSVLGNKKIYSGPNQWTSLYLYSWDLFYLYEQIIFFIDTLMSLALSLLLCSGCNRLGRIDPESSGRYR